MSRLTKKHYVAIANALKETSASSETIVAISYALAGTNELFDRAKFCRASITTERQRYEMAQMGIVL